ncbi:hypothetical protein NFI96_000412 [Prochilodus magdalenae]|nr:hypothetical protein NFI96_000412 [Prochilodus magdalenae]
MGRDNGPQIVLGTKWNMVVLVRWNEPFQKLATCDADGGIFVWIQYEGRWSVELVNDRGAQVSDFTWSHDGTQALISYRDGFVLVGSVNGQRHWSSEINLESQITCGIWTPDDQQWSSQGDLFAVAGLERHLVTTDPTVPPTNRKAVVKFYNSHGEHIFLLETPALKPINTLCWGHRDSRLFLACGPALYVVRVEHQVASLQLLCQQLIASTLREEKDVAKLTIPSRLSTYVSSAFAPTIKPPIPDASNMRDFVSYPTSGNERLYCSMKRTEDDLEVGGPCYTLYLEYLGGLVPILKGRRISKLRPEFIIMDPKTDKTDELYGNTLISTVVDSCNCSDSSDNELCDDWVGKRSPKMSRGSKSPKLPRINIDTRKSPKLSRATQEVSRSPRLPIRKPSIGSPSLSRREFPLEDTTQHNYLAQVTSNIWGTKFKIVGLASFMPTNLGAVIYKTSLLHLQPRQMTVYLPEVRKISTECISLPVFSSNVFSEDEDDLPVTGTPGIINANPPCTVNIPIAPIHSPAQAMSPTQSIGLVQSLLANQNVQLGALSSPTTVSPTGVPDQGKETVLMTQHALPTGSEQALSGGKEAGHLLIIQHLSSEQSQHQQQQHPQQSAQFQLFQPCQQQHLQRLNQQQYHLQLQQQRQIQHQMLRHQLIQQHHVQVQIQQLQQQHVQQLHQMQQHHIPIHIHQQHQHQLHIPVPSSPASPNPCSGIALLQSTLQTGDCGAVQGEHMIKPICLTSQLAEGDAVVFGAPLDIKKITPTPPCHGIVATALSTPTATSSAASSVISSSGAAGDLSATPPPPGDSCLENGDNNLQSFDTQTALHPAPLGYERITTFDSSGNVEEVCRPRTKLVCNQNLYTVHCSGSSATLRVSPSSGEKKGQLPYTSTTLKNNGSLRYSTPSGDPHPDTVNQSNTVESPEQRFERKGSILSVFNQQKAQVPFCTCSECSSSSRNGAIITGNNVISDGTVNRQDLQQLLMPLQSPYNFISLSGNDSLESDSGIRVTTGIIHSSITDEELLNLNQLALTTKGTDLTMKQAPPYQWDPSGTEEIWVPQNRTVHPASLNPLRVTLSPAQHIDFSDLPFILSQNSPMPSSATNFHAAGSCQMTLSCSPSTSSSGPNASPKELSAATPFSPDGQTPILSSESIANLKSPTCCLLPPMYPVVSSCTSPPMNPALYSYNPCPHVPSPTGTAPVLPEKASHRLEKPVLTPPSQIPPLLLPSTDMHGSEKGTSEAAEGLQIGLSIGKSPVPPCTDMFGKRNQKKSDSGRADEASVPPINESCNKSRKEGRALGDFNSFISSPRLGGRDKKKTKGQKEQQKTKKHSKVTTGEFQDSSDTEPELVISGDELMNHNQSSKKGWKAKRNLRSTGCELDDVKSRKASEKEDRGMGNQGFAYIMANKQPLWNEATQVYQLDFGGRVTQESAKNFQIELEGRQVMQFGRTDGNAYILDFQHPFSAVQAFAVALANVTQRLKLAPMRLYTLTRRHFALVFAVFLLCFVLTVLIGVAGPKVIAENSYNVLSTANVSKTGPFDIKSPPLSNYNQQLWLLCVIQMTQNNEEDFRKSFEFNVELKGVMQDASIMHISDNVHHKSRSLHCALPHQFCDEFVVVHLGYLNYTLYQINVTLKGLDGKSQNIQNITFVIKTYNPKFSQVEIWFRFVFVVLTFIVTGERRFLTFYLPKLVIVGLMWISAVTLGIWQLVNELQDPTYQYNIDMQHFQGMKIFFLLVVVLYVLYLVFLLVRAWSELKNLPYSDSQMKDNPAFSMLNDSDDEVIYGSDYEVMPLQNGRAIKTTSKYQDETDSD